MSVHHWVLLGGFVVFTVSACFHLLRVVRKSRIDDLSEGKGSIFAGILHSMTGAMLPVKKETAYLHLPTYALGIVYHSGSFLAFLWVVLHLFSLTLPTLAVKGSIIFFIVTGGSGIAIFMKRVIDAKLRHLSTPEDYFSNLMVTGFQFLSAWALLRTHSMQTLFIYTGILFAYIPIGKLRHVIYFLIARFYLGLFYGKRGVWPPKRRKAWVRRPL